MYRMGLLFAASRTYLRQRTVRGDNFEGRRVERSVVLGGVLRLLLNHKIVGKKHTVSGIALISRPIYFTR